MATAIAANRLELLQIADAVARDKSIDKQVVLTAMEEAMQRAAKAHYGTENDIKVDIDPKTGETHVSRYLHVVEQVENDKTEISLADARARNPAAQVGDIIAETLPPVDFNRINAQAAKQVIVQKVRDAERERQYEEYKDRIGEIVHGVVKRSEFGSVVVDLGKAEGVVRRDEMIPRESFRVGDRIRAYIYDVRREARGPQIFLSRSHPQFMVRLFAQEVPEIYDGIIEIRAVARDPGSRAKIAVISKDSSIDPVGACVGMRGVRVQAVVQELQGERIDIIPWNGEAAAFIVNALAPAEVSKVVLDEDTHRVEVVVPDEQLSLGIGIALARIDETDLGLVVLHQLDHMQIARDMGFAGLGIDIDLDVVLAAVMGLGGALHRFFHGGEDHGFVDRLVAGDGVGDLQQFEPVGGNSHSTSPLGWRSFAPSNLRR
jgi:N utilization substance protein A